MSNIGTVVRRPTVWLQALIVVCAYLFEEAALPLAATGTAVGLISVVGYTPDVFVNLVAGWFLDRWPGAAGHQHFFVFLGCFAVAGLIASLLFRRIPNP